MGWLITIGGLFFLLRGITRVFMAFNQKGKKKQSHTVTITTYTDSGKRVEQHTIRD